MDQLTPGQEQIYRMVLAWHPGAVVLRCGDEWTGERFGLAKCRYGRSAKLGYTGYSLVPNIFNGFGRKQIWVSWADHDIRKQGE